MFREIELSKEDKYLNIETERAERELMMVDAREQLLAQLQQNAERESVLVKSREQLIAQLQQNAMAEAEVINIRRENAVLERNFLIVQINKMNYLVNDDNTLSYQAHDE